MLNKALNDFIKVRLIFIYDKVQLRSTETPTFTDNRHGQMARYAKGVQRTYCHASPSLPPSLPPYSLAPRRQLNVEYVLRALFVRKNWRKGGAGRGRRGRLGPPSRKVKRTGSSPPPSDSNGELTKRGTRLRNIFILQFRVVISTYPRSCMKIF